MSVQQACSRRLFNCPLIAAFALLLCLKSTALFAQGNDVKSQVYQAFLSRNVFRYDSVYHKRIDNVFILPLNEKLQKLDFDAEYLKDYLSGNISSNRIFQEHVQPRGNDTVSWLSYPWGLDRMLRKDKPAGYLLLQVDSVMHLPHQLPDYAKGKKEFPEWNGTQPIDVADWKKLYRKHRRCYGFIAVSDVVFTANGRRAAFYYQERRHSMDGWGGVIFMKQTATGWEEDFSLQFWVS